MGNIQLQKATRNPTEFPATKIELLDIIYPTANNRRSMSRKNKVRNRAHELLIAATVKITVRMNQAHINMANALLNSGVNIPVSASV